MAGGAVPQAPLNQVVDAVPERDVHAAVAVHLEHVVQAGSHRSGFAQVGGRQRILAQHVHHRDRMHGCTHAVAGNVHEVDHEMAFVQPAIAKGIAAQSRGGQQYPVGAHRALVQRRGQQRQHVAAGAFEIAVQFLGGFHLAARAPLVLEDAVAHPQPAPRGEPRLGRHPPAVHERAVGGVEVGHGDVGALHGDAAVTARHAGIGEHHVRGFRPPDHHRALQGDATARRVARHDHEVVGAFLGILGSRAGPGEHHRGAVEGDCGERGSGPGPGKSRAGAFERIVGGGHACCRARPKAGIISAATFP